MVSARSRRRAVEQRLGSKPGRALSWQEGAELARQGAKAAARGEPVSSNPMDLDLNGPQATGEPKKLWTQRSDAWLTGHERQSSTAQQGRAPSGTSGDEHD